MRFLAEAVRSKLLTLETVRTRTGHCKIQKGASTHPPTRDLCLQWSEHDWPVPNERGYAFWDQAEVRVNQPRFTPAMAAGGSHPSRGRQTLQRLICG
jgi:hypothetical protein